MDWKGIAPTISKSAPLLGAIIGGPAGAQVGTLISGILGTSNEPDAVLTAIQSIRIKLQS